MQSNKRKFPSEKIDIFFLINQKRILSKTEYLNKNNIEKPYEEYLEMFYKRRIVDVFDTLKTQEWFRCRYLQNAREVQNEAPISDNFIVFENCQVEYLKDFKINIQKIEEIKKIFVSQNGYFQDYKLDIYLNLNEEANPENVIRKMESGDRAFALNTSELGIEESYAISLDDIKSIFMLLCRLDRQNPDEIRNRYDNDDSVQTYIRILRDVFRYCIICSKQYDNCVEMMRFCYSHLKNNICYRNIEIACGKKDFSKIEYINEESEIKKLSIRIPEIHGFKCRICEKTFSSMEYIIQHAQTKHSEMVDEIKQIKSEFDLFISNIDMFILEIIEGTGDKNTPPFGREMVVQQQVVYDLPCLFSGEMKFN